MLMKIKLNLKSSFEQNGDFIIGCPYFPIKKLTEAVNDEFDIKVPIKKFFKEEPGEFIIKTFCDLGLYIIEKVEERE